MPGARLIEMVGGRVSQNKTRVKPNLELSDITRERGGYKLGRDKNRFI